MAQQHQAGLEEYTFHRRIHNLVSDELGKAVCRIHNELFEGTSLVDHTQYQEGQPLAFSNVLRALSYTQILHQLTKGRIQVASPRDVVRYWNDIPGRDENLADTNAISVFPGEGFNEDLRQRVLALLERQTLDVPLLVSGLGVERADNSHGFTFTRTALTQAREAPYLKQDCRVRYDQTTDELVIARDDEEGVQICTQGDQLGLRRAYRYGDEGIDFGCDRLLGSSTYSQVQVVEKDQKAA